MPSSPVPWWLPWSIRAYDSDYGVIEVACVTYNKGGIIKLKMEMFLDKNGTNLQRRKMYLGFPLHNMKSHLNFDWQNDDPSVQDQMGKRFKLAQEQQQLRRKYEQIVEQKLNSRYNELHEEDLYAPHKQKQSDVLTKELENFNNSKVISGQGLDNSRVHRPQDLDRSMNQLSQSQNVRDSPRRDRAYSLEHQEPNLHYEHPYNPENYYTLSPTADRMHPNEPNYELGSSPSKFVQKMHTGTVVNDYPFRNVIPDKLETHLREKMKADRHKAVRVNLNLFDYYTKP